MATLQASFCSVRKPKSNFQAPKISLRKSLSIPKLHHPHDQNQRTGSSNLTSKNTQFKPITQNQTRKLEITNSEAVKELHEIMNMVADREEMHKNIGVQRDNWNTLFLSSVNGMIMAAATLAGLASINEGAGAGGRGQPILALKLSSSLLYFSACGFLLVINKIQPSQLAEEQRNASRLFKQLHEEIRTAVLFNNVSSNDVEIFMEKVLALDKAYPLPLLGGAMLEKFPQAVKPAVWWPRKLKFHEENDKRKRNNNNNNNNSNNGWNEKLEEEMKGVAKVLKRRDEAEYLRLSEVALKVNKVLAICGPVLLGLAGIGTMLIGPSLCGSWAGFLGVGFGALAMVVNSLEHGGQVGMVFEMYRSAAGIFRLIEEEIETNLKETQVEKRENGDSLKLKVALELGRDVSELEEFINNNNNSQHEDVKIKFGSVLF